jgi:AraC family transcriptional regulator of arabinose operon
MSIGPPSTIQAERADIRVRLAFEMLKQSAAGSDFNFEKIARYVNLSPSRLRHLFTGNIGISPMHYVKLVRLERAHNLMLESFLTVKEVTNRSGFSDVSHFVREYKRRFGETPSQTRIGLRRIS